MFQVGNDRKMNDPSICQEGRTHALYVKVEVSDSPNVIGLLFIGSVSADPRREGQK
jgi:hypothetical protein